MKIHAMYGLDLPTGSAAGLSSNQGAITRLPNGPWQTLIPNTETSMTFGSTGTAGWVALNLTAGAYNFGNYRFRIVVDIKEMVPVVTPTSDLFFGFRVKTGTGYTGAHVLGLSSAVDISNGLALIATGDLPAYAIGKEYYVEVRLNFATNTIERRVGGKPLANMNMPAWMATAVSASPAGTSVYLGIGHVGPYNIQQGQTHGLQWRDFYCVEWESGDLPQFLGSQIVEKIPAAGMSTTPWVPSTGTALSVIQKGYSDPSTPITAPTLTTDDAMTPVTITYNPANIPQNALITGVIVKGRAAVTVNATGTLGVSCTVNGTETPDANTSMVAAQTWYDKLQVLPKTPAGQQWTQPALAGLTVKVKPKV